VSQLDTHSKLTPDSEFVYKARLRGIDTSTPVPKTANVRPPASKQAMSFGVDSICQARNYTKAISARTMLILRVHRLPYSEGLRVPTTPTSGLMP